MNDFKQVLINMVQVIFAKNVKQGGQADPFILVLI